MRILHPLKKSVFGRVEVIDHGISSSDLIVALGNKGYGLVPLWVGMPHQLYTSHIDRWEKDGHIRIHVAPIGERVLVAERE